jgi:putative glutamine amidotransferase
VTAPLVGIVAQPMAVKETEGIAPYLGADRRYVEALVAAGGRPRLVLMGPAADAGHDLAGVQALVLTGGVDVDPARYDRPASPQTGPTDPERDGWEVAAVRAALSAGLPLLAVCRGAQILNVALGGSLTQHVEGHWDPSRQDDPVHPVLSGRGGFPPGWFVPGTEKVGVNTLHHQCLDEPGEGVEVLAWAPDKVPELVGLRGRPEVLAVQWHPELMPQHDQQQRLFSHLVRLASASPVG